MRKREFVKVLLGVWLGLAGAGVADGIAQEARFDGVTLRIGTYGGTWRDAIHQLIGTEIERRGAKVEYVIGNPRDNLAKLIAARGQTPPFDVMELTDAVKRDLVESGFAAQLDYGKIPNARELDPAHRDALTVATWTSQEGIVYNGEKFKEQGIPKPERWIDLAHPKLKGHVAFHDINVGGVVNAIIGFAYDSGGSITNIDPGLEAIKKLEIAAFSKSSVDLATRFKSGDVWIAPWHAGYVVRMRRDGVPLDIVYPPVDGKRGMLQLGWVAVVKGAREAAAAHFFIDRYLDADVSAELARRNGVGPLTRAANQKLGEDPALKDIMLLTPESIRNAYVADWSKIDMGVWVEKWNRAMAR